MRIVIIVLVLLAATLTGLAQIAPPATGGPATATATTPNSLGEPTRITLHMHNLPVADVVAALSKQANYPMTLPPRQYSNVTKVTVDVDQAPFWEAMRQLLDRADLGFPFVGGGGAGAPNPETIPLGGITSPYWLNAPYHQQGGFCVSLMTTRWDASYQPPLLTMDMMVLMDPRTCLLSYGEELQEAQATDDTQGQLKPLTATVNHLRPADVTRWQVGVQARFSKPDHAISKVAHFRAAERVVVATRHHTWEVRAADLAGARVESPWGTFSVAGLGGDDNTRYTLHCILDYTPAQMARMPGGLNWIPGALRLLDEKGRALAYRGVSSGTNTGGHLEIACDFSTLMPDNTVERYGKPVKLQWEIPDEVQEMLVPIVFDDIPVPARK